jgi:hypothetical protein
MDGGYMPTSGPFTQELLGQYLFLSPNKKLTVKSKIQQFVSSRRQNNPVIIAASEEGTESWKRVGK